MQFSLEFGLYTLVQEGRTKSENCTIISMRGKKDFISCNHHPIAHDLKTPLTAITGFIELLSMQKNITEKEKQEYYELIIKKSNHMAELLEAFTKFTKDELKLETIDMKPVESKRLFENIAAEYETELSGFDCKLSWKHNFHSTS